jgi:hypothetical protein
MAKVLKFPKFQDFLNHNRAEIKANYFVYYHLTQLIPRLNNKELDLYDAYNAYGLLETILFIATNGLMKSSLFFLRRLASKNTEISFSWAKGK